MPDFPAMLNVAIGLIFVFLLLSLVVTWLQESLANWFQLRSKGLAAAIHNLLKPSQAATSSAQLAANFFLVPNDKLVEKLSDDAVTALYAHPLIKSLARPNKLPSYIDSRSFALALFDLLAKAGTADAGSAQTFEAIRHGVDKLGDPTTKGALLALLNATEATEAKAENRVAAARLSVQSWFDTTMDRASGWYKRQVLVITVIIGMAVAIGLNVDSIGLARELWQDPALRASASAAAAAYVQKGDASNAQAAQSQLLELKLPIGWSGKFAGPAGSEPIDPRDFPSQPIDWLVKLLGLVMTGFAISQGAPVWFDFLKNLVNINPRATGARPESTTSSSG